MTTATTNLRHGLRLTPGERFWLSRKRSGVTQDALADLLGVRVDLLRRWEVDDGDVPDIPMRPADLSQRLLLMLWMRRTGCSIPEIATALDMSVGWVHGALGGGSGAARVERYVAHRVATA